MKARWAHVELDALTENDRSITYGVVKPGEEVEGGVTFVRGGDLSQGRIALGELRTIAPQLSQVYKRTILRGGELLISLVGNPGEVAIAPPSLDGANIARQVGLIALRSELDARFVMYFLMSPLGRAELFTRTGGAVQQVINLADLKTLKVPVPSKKEQRQIADTLSAYDELMENNRRRMELLEESARLLYREWFVRLRFPGHEHARLTYGIPEGWTTYTLDDLCLIGRGSSPRPIADFMGGEVPWFKIGDATASESFYIFHTAEHVTDEGTKRSILLEPGSLILSNSATCGIPNFTGVRGCIHDGWLHFADLKRISQQFLYCYLHFKRDELVRSVGDGSTQKNLNTTAVGRLKVVLPPRELLLIQFDDFVEPMFKMIFNLARQNISLRAARDLLLPRLMSGEIAL